MSKQVVQVEVSGSSYALGKLIAGIVVAAKQGKSATEIAGAEVADLIAALGQISNISQDIKDDHLAFVNGALLPIEDAIKALLVKA